MIVVVKNAWRRKWLFQVFSGHTKDKPIRRVSVSSAFKESWRNAWIADQHALYAQEPQMALYSVSVEVLKHNNMRLKLRYLGITNEKVLKMYDYALEKLSLVKNFGTNR